MYEYPRCPACDSELTYDDGRQFVCPECANEWPKTAPASEDGDGDGEKVVRDAYGTVLHDGDSVTVIKDLKVKGSGMTVKVGTKVKGIRLVEGDHDIDCKFNGVGIFLKSEFVKKA